jgi:protein O-GlcNAc transferase
MDQVLLNRANMALSHGNFESAIAGYDEYLKSNPASGEAWHNRGIALAQTKRFAPAAHSFGKALSLHPESAASWHNRGLAFAELEQFGQAIRDHTRALALQPRLPNLRGDLVLAKLNACDWHDLAPERRRISQALLNGEPAIAPFGNLLISDSAEDQLLCARTWMVSHAAPVPPLWRGERYHHDRIRVSYVSGDFRAHPVGALIVSLLESHDREKFESFGVSFGPDDGSEMRSRIAAALEHFIDVRGRSDLEIARVMCESEIDIAVDLMGITADCRPGIFAARPAPVQAAYLGYPGTMGAEFIDYVLADGIVVPEGTERFFSEKIAWLPNCYLPAACAPEPPQPWTRAEAGLPEDVFVFCCFNTNFKILPETFASWMTILRAAENSVLWLGQPNAMAQANLKREISRAGIAENRLIFAPRVESFDDHIRRLAAADLFLDTLPFNAHSTAIDALSAGVPVLTCSGATMVARAGASVLSAIGLPELIAGTMQDYERMAIGFARDRGALAAIRDKLSRNRACTPLFDRGIFARHFEAALTEMHVRQISGLPPHSFAVSGKQV